jgi:hypothetical protein
MFFLTKTNMLYQEKSVLFIFSWQNDVVVHLTYNIVEELRQCIWTCYYSTKVFSPYLVLDLTAIQIWQCQQFAIFMRKWVGA